MAEISELNVFPLTGAQAVNHDVVDVSVAGISGDRTFLLYDSETRKRISQKQYPQLATVDAWYFTEDHNVLGVSFPSGTDELATSKDRFLEVDARWTREDIEIDEFEQLTPSIDLGDGPAERFSKFLGYGAVRLARKAPFWTQGFADVDKNLADWKFGDVADRKVAPIHIVTTSSVEALQGMLEGSDFGPERFRANIVIDSDADPFSENDWVGKKICIAGLSIHILRTTARCPVPGYDQVTGENKKDVPKAYRDLPKTANNKPIFGVYGAAFLKPTERGTIGVGDRIDLPDSSDVVLS